MIWNLFQKWIGIRVHNNQLKKKRSKGTQSYTWVPLFEMKHNYAADITIGLKNTNFIDSKNVSLNFVWQLQRKRLHSLQARVAILVFWSAKSHQFWRGLWDIASTDIVAKKSKMSVNQSPGGYLGFLIRFGRKNAYVEGIEIVISVKFRWITFNGCRKNWNILSRSDAKAAILVFRFVEIKLGRRDLDLASCHVSLNSSQQLQRRKNKIYTNLAKYARRMNLSGNYNI